MEYFSNNKKEDVKNKKNPSKIYIPLNTNRVNSNSKQLGSGFPDSKTIEFFSTVNRGIQTGLITLPATTGDNIYTVNGTIPEARTILLEDNTINFNGDNWKFSIGEFTPFESQGWYLGNSSANAFLGMSKNATTNQIVSTLLSPDGGSTYNNNSVISNTNAKYYINFRDGVTGNLLYHEASNSGYLWQITDTFTETQGHQFKIETDRVIYTVTSGTSQGIVYEDYADISATSNTLVPKSYVDGEIAFYGVDKIIEITTATHSVLGVNATYHVTAAGSTLTIQTSVISDGNRFRIKDAIGNASVNNIVIQTQGAELIDGDGAGVTINSDYGYIELYCFNNNLFIKQ